VLATANAGKVAEIAAVVGDRFELVARPVQVPEVAETEATLLGNARLKARALSEATGLPALADDTGLEVDALGGAPGVRSARYAGEGACDADNVARLLRDLTGAADRRGRFRTVVVVAFPDGSELVAEGSVAGSVAREPRGGRGFGYDPVFEPDGGGGCTFAELSAAQKNGLSHRGRALRALVDMWPA